MSEPGAIVEAASPMDAAESVVGYGGFWRRVAAESIDSAIFIPVSFLLDMVSGTANGGIAATLLLMLAYEAGMTASSLQATLGKMALGLKVVDADGQRLTINRSIGRWFAKIPAGLFFCTGFIMVAFTERKRGLHDMICATLVLHVDRRPQGALPAPPVETSRPDQA